MFGVAQSHSKNVTLCRGFFKANRTQTHRKERSPPKKTTKQKKEEESFRNTPTPWLAKRAPDPSSRPARRGSSRPMESRAPLTNLRALGRARQVQNPLRTLRRETIIQGESSYKGWSILTCCPLYRGIKGFFGAGFRPQYDPCFQAPTFLKTKAVSQNPQLPCLLEGAKNTMINVSWLKNQILVCFIMFIWSCFDMVV